MRPTFGGENSRQFQGSFPDEIACIRVEWLDSLTFAQLIVRVPEQTVDYFRTDRGEEVARLAFEAYDDSPRLARRDLICPVDGVPCILGMRTCPGVLPPTPVWVVAHWHPDGHIDREWLRLAGMERAAA